MPLAPGSFCLYPHPQPKHLAFIFSTSRRTHGGPRAIHGSDPRGLCSFPPPRSREQNPGGSCPPPGTCASFPALQTEATLSLPSCLFIFRESVSFSGFRVPAVVQVADLISNPRQSMDIVIYSFNRERLNVPLRQTQFRFWESDSEEDRQGVYP